MSEAVQITIPDFDEDEFSSTPIPFGRSGGQAFGFGGAAFGHGQESPTATTPLAERVERTYFHSRGDSVNSVDSGHSGRYVGSKPGTPFGNASQSSIATPAPPLGKKASFAAIRNAFKSGKNSEAPPVPSLDHQAYPVLKNPFNRSTSSLTTTTSSLRRPAEHSSPTPFRSVTPNTESSRFGRSVTPKSKYAKSQHSQSGSIFHNSDTGSDYGHQHNHSSSPPPVPRVPFGSQSRSETPPIPDFDDTVVMDPRTPSDYALHAVFMRFATAAEMKIDNFLRQPLDADPMLPDLMGPGVDTQFDDVLQSLGKIGKKHTKPVVDSILRWRRSQNENVSAEMIRMHLSQSSGPSQRAVPAVVLNERKSLVSIYIMCHALIAVLQSISKDALGEAMGYTLEEITFEQFRRPDLKLLAQSANHRVNAELYATLLGLIANVRFESVTDRFLAELGPVSSGQVPKDLDMKYENLVKGIRHIQIKVWPPESFEEGAEFLESLSKSFCNAHGLRLKSTFAETLVHLLHPIGKTAQAEVNHPVWAKAIEMIYPKAKEMMTKPRYWSVAYPLAITSLCVAPHQFFLRNWVACFEISVSKLKERSNRIPAMNGIIRLIWTYLYRCQESASATTTKLDSMLRVFFPANKTSVVPADDRLEPLIYILHFVLSRHPEFGQDLCLDLIHESAVKGAQPLNVVNVMAPERTAIVIQAILLSLSGIEREQPTPTWPSSMDFGIIPPWTDYPTSSTALPLTMLAKQGIKDFIERCGLTLAAVAKACHNAVGNMSVFDEQWVHQRPLASISYDEAPSVTTRRHLDGTVVAFPIQLVPQINMLQTCYQAWPRLLHSSISLGEAVDVVLKGITHVEPILGEQAEAALKRFMADSSQALLVLSRYTALLFNPARMIFEGSGTKLYLEHPHLLNLWVTTVEEWANIVTGGEIEEEQRRLILARTHEMEAGALFLLANEASSVVSAGGKVIRILGLLVDHLGSDSVSPRSLRVLDLLHGRGLEASYLHGFEDLLEQPDLERLLQWRQSVRADVPLRMADSTNELDRHLWRFVYASLLQDAMDHPSPALTAFRDSLVIIATRYHPTVLFLAGLTNRAPPSMAARSSPQGEREASRFLQEHYHRVMQWAFCMRILSTTSTFSESRQPYSQNAREHSRAPSDPGFEQERMTTTRGLFRHLTPFLHSEFLVFRDAAVLCISALPSVAYTQLLEDLSALAARQFYDDPRLKSQPQSAALLAERTKRQERLHSAVARIYFLTAHFLQPQRTPAALANVIKFVRNTQTFLTSPEMRDNHTLQRLRRYFCGTLERLFDGMTTLVDSDRFIPPNMHLALFRLCEEWCQFGVQADHIKQRLVIMQRAAASTAESMDESDSIGRFQRETVMLSDAAVGAMASLCRKAFFPPEISSGSPIATERAGADYSKPLETVLLLDRLTPILACSRSPIQVYGKKALKALLTGSTTDYKLMDECLHRAFVKSQDLQTSSGRFFEVVQEVVHEEEVLPFSFSQVVCLGLSNLCHPLVEIRRLAFSMLETLHDQVVGSLSMAQFEATVSSQAPSTYLHAHRLISDFLATEHPSQADRVLTQLARRLPQLHEISGGKVTLPLLQSLEYWVSSIDLMVEDRTSLSREGICALYHMVALTMRYRTSHAEQILVLWAQLLVLPSNGQATIRFLIEQSHKVGSTVFISCAANVVACLTQTPMGPQIFQELCSIIVPARMLPTIDHKLNFPDAADMELWADLDALFAEQPRLPLGTAQFALLFMADVTLDRQWDMQEELPILLHALFVHLDNRSPFVRQRAHRMLFQLLKSWAPGYDVLVHHSAYPTRSELKLTLANLESEAQTRMWKEEDSGAECRSSMQWLCTQVVEFMEPLSPGLTERWGSLALDWGTSCSIRPTAFRSLQIFCALMPRATEGDLSLLLGRLANTIAGPDESMHSFTVEMISTMTAIVKSETLDMGLVPQLFWCACASLSTTVEQEYNRVLELLDAILMVIDLNDPQTSAYLVAHRPPNWSGSPYLQPALLTGLRSATTSGLAISILQTLARIEDDSLVGPTEDRVRDMYTIALPWCLNSMVSDTQDPALREFATSIGVLAQHTGRASISRIMESWVKSRFRTKDDFLRQSVGSLREHYGADHWTEIVTLLMGLVLNRERWLRVHTMQILKVLFQQRVSVDLLGSELIMPLLRLLETDLASQALEVLDEPITISGGPAAKHVLRMSMHVKPAATEISESITHVFGMAEESGWCIAQAETLRDICRANLTAVLYTCAVSSRPSRVVFEPETDVFVEGGSKEDLGGLVQDLHALTAFFQEDEILKTPLPMPSQQLEARVAAILAKSTSTQMDVPQTPFMDVFNIPMGMPNDESDDSDDSEVEDAFIFDSPAMSYRGGGFGGGGLMNGRHGF